MKALHACKVNCIKCGHSGTMVDGNAEWQNLCSAFRQLLLSVQHPSATKMYAECRNSTYRLYSKQPLPLAA